MSRCQVVEIAVLFVAALAHADPQPVRPFDAAYQSGQDLFYLGKYAEAHAAFLRARSLAPRLPGPHRWLGRVARVLEKWEECVASATEAVRLRPDSPHLPEVREDLDTCRAALGRPGYGKKLAAGQGALAIIVDSERVHIFVDGIDRGVAPVAPFPLNAGRHRVRLETGGRVVEAPVDVVPGIVTDAVLTPPSPRR
jgi:tetratricopeptide (TPR) repeat protein